ncbi:hypothetical protein WCX49_11815 [Sulfurimonas sp. HSL-1656]|uniref:hypothetical protein n=1 Tax=Thiomicrolovo subterrani TaxID=3131934 RepID=UPI0031F798FC
MTKTNYTIHHQGNIVVIMQHGKVETKCINEESALQSVWKLEGSDRKKYFVARGEAVYECERAEMNGITAIIKEHDGKVEVEIDGRGGSAMFMSMEEARSYIDTVFEEANDATDA